jgi:hypothetical protein
MRVYTSTVLGLAAREPWYRNLVTVSHLLICVRVQPMSIRTVVLDQVKLVAEHQQKSLLPLVDTLPLLDSGLDSLCIAIIVANLEEELGFDPFGSGNTVIIPQTLGEFIGLYENGAA